MKELAFLSGLRHARASWLTLGHRIRKQPEHQHSATGLEEKEEKFVLPLKITETIGSGFPNVVLGMLKADSTITRSMALDGVRAGFGGRGWEPGRSAPDRTAQERSRGGPGRGEGEAGDGWVSDGY